MKDNIVFQNILETHDENVKETLHSFLKNDMKMSTPALDQVRISKIYQQGAARTNKSYPRQIVAKINDDGRQAIWKHTRNLSGSKFRVFTQLPRELAERKRQLIPQYNAAKAKKIPVKWAAEKLVVNGELTEVKRDAVTDINLDVTDRAMSMRVKKTMPRSCNGNTVCGSLINITSTDEAVAGLRAVYADYRSARANSNTYAYRLKQGESISEHYEDDNEYGTGRRLLDLLKTRGITNQMVVVTSWIGSRNVDTNRFKNIMQAANEVIGM